MRASSLFLACVTGFYAVSQGALPAAVTFQFNPDPGTSQAVLDAFGIAASRWSAVLQDNVTVTLNIGYTSLPSGVLGQTDYSFVQRSYSTVTAALNASGRSATDFSAYATLQQGETYSRLINRTSDHPLGSGSATPYVNTVGTVALTRANARALGLLGNDGTPDATIRMNSEVPFDFNPADGVTSGQFDFVTVATHEIGHALGFSSVVNLLELGPTTAAQLPSTTLDLFRFSAESMGAGRGFSDVTADGRLKYFSVDGGITTTGPLANGAVFGSGAQADHWREWTFSGIMDAQNFPGLQRQIGVLDLKAYDVIGWTVPEPGVPAVVFTGCLVSLLRHRKRPR